LLRQNEVRFRQCQSVRQDWCTTQLTTDHKPFEARQSAYEVMDRWRSQCRAWFKTCHFQVTPKIDRTLMVKRFSF
jgi:hypothetical protein